MDTPPADPRHRHRAGGDRDLAVRRSRHCTAAGAQPGGVIDAAAVCGDSAGALRVGSSIDGHAGGTGVASAHRLGDRCGDRLFEHQAVVGYRAAVTGDVG
ncbi:hypothetical protein XHV734_2270 [Xanthomonas hortorum pv. vitians]|nr:hypothetical protein XHV734_2270 [Xanthomonas hortorum pv. vitians]